MKRKLLTVILAVVLTLGCFAGLLACGNKVDGTYYVYVKGEKQEGMSIVFDGDKVTTQMSMEGSTTSVEGTFEVKDNKIVITVTVMGVTQTQELEIVSDGVLTDGELYYCKDGKTPPEEEEAA